MAEAAPPELTHAAKADARFRKPTQAQLENDQRKRGSAVLRKGTFITSETPYIIENPKLQIKPREPDKAIAENPDSPPQEENIEIEVPWTIFGGSVKGAKHEREGKPNEDALEIIYPEKITDPTIILAADGKKGAPKALEGAQLAVKIAKEHLQKLSSDGKPVTQQQAKDAGKAIIGQWQETVKDEPSFDASLLAAVAMQDQLILFQIGEGDIVVVDSEGVSKRVPQQESIVKTLSSEEKALDVTIIPIETGKKPKLVMLSTSGTRGAKPDDQFLKFPSALVSIAEKHGLESSEDFIKEMLPKFSEHVINGERVGGSDEDVTAAFLFAKDNPTSQLESQKPVTEEEIRKLDSYYQSSINRLLTEAKIEPAGIKELAEDKDTAKVRALAEKYLNSLRLFDNDAINTFLEKGLPTLTSHDKVTLLLRTVEGLDYANANPEVIEDDFEYFHDYYDLHGMTPLPFADDAIKAEVVKQFKVSRGKKDFVAPIHVNVLSSIDQIYSALLDFKVDTTIRGYYEKVHHDVSNFPDALAAKDRQQLKPAA